MLGNHRAGFGSGSKRDCCRQRVVQGCAVGTRAGHTVLSFSATSKRVLQDFLAERWSIPTMEQGHAALGAAHKLLPGPCSPIPKPQISGERWAQVRGQSSERPLHCSPLCHTRVGKGPASTAGKWAVLCRAMPCCARLCSAVLCHAVCCSTVPYRTMPCSAVQCRAMLFCAVPC